MRDDLPVELGAKNDLILASPGRRLLVLIAGIPDSRFGHEVKSGLVNHDRLLVLGVGPEEDCGTEDSLERRD